MTLKESIDVLKNNTCACGKCKDRKKAFCKYCFSLLPDFIQNSLYEKLGDGFENAYENSIEYLKFHYPERMK